MKTVGTPLIGRFGNQLFQYAHARAYAGATGMTLVTPNWIGRRIFNIEDPVSDSPDVMLGGYCQDQESLIYTRSQVKQWFSLKDGIRAALEGESPVYDVVVHRRFGDYLDLGYPVPSDAAVERALLENGHDPANASFAKEESPLRLPSFDGELSFLPDFWRMMTAKTLFRANSTFSWWAATLGTCRVFSPVIEGFGAGTHDDVRYVAGNWPRLANFPFTTDLHMQD